MKTAALLSISLAFIAAAANAAEIHVGKFSFWRIRFA